MAEFKVKLSEDKLLAIVNSDKQKAVDYYNSELRDNFKNWEDLFNGDPDFYNVNAEYQMPKSRYVSRDIMATIRSVQPDLMRLLISNEPVDITGRNAEDMDKARKMQVLCNWQVTRLNDFFMVCNSIFSEALLKGMAVLKVTWEKTVEDKDFEEQLTEADIDELQAQGIDIKSAAFIGEQPDGSNLYNVSYKAGVITKNQPRLEPLPSGEFLFDPAAKSIQEAAYCIHRKIVTKDYLKRKEDEGIYKNVSRIKNVHSSFTDDEDELFSVDDQYRPGNDGTDNKARDTVVLTEYWGKVDVNQDGRLENVVITSVGSVILSVEENTFDMYPFFAFSPFPSAYKIPGMGVAEMVEGIQAAKTAFVREMLENTRKNNDRKTFYSEGAFLAPSQMNDPHEKYVAIREGVPLQNVVYSEPFDPISPNVPSIIQYLDLQRQFNTGVSEMKQGVRTDEKQTATEASIKYEAANAQTQMMVVIMAYKLKEVYEFLVYQNQKFIDEPQVIRLLNVPIEIDPEDLQGKFDLQVSASLGGGTAETRRRTLNNVLQILVQVAEPRGLTDMGRIRNVIAKLLEESGLKDVDSYLMSEEEISRREEAAAQQAQAAAGGIVPGGVPPEMGPDMRTGAQGAAMEGLVGQVR